MPHHRGQPGRRHLQRHDLATGGGRLGFGSASNIRISLVEELRGLEYSQRLRDTARATLAEPERSTGRVLYEAGLDGDATAAGRDTGAIREGLWADLCALALDTPVMAGRHVVRDGRHLDRDRIVADYLACVTSLQEQM